MKLKTSIVFSITAVAALGATGLAFAGAPAPGSITFAPVGSTSIPAMGGVGLVILAVVMGFIALQAFRRKQAGQSLVSFLGLGLGTGALLAAFGGISLISESKAVGPLETDMTELAVQTWELSGRDTNLFNNLSGGELSVIELELPLGCSLDGISHQSDPPCALGFVLADGDSCQVPCLESGLPSDRRLKTDITVVGTASNGLTLYNFRYIGDDVLYQGVMAQDVLKHTPSAVVTRPDGFMAVNYSALGLELTRVD